MSHYRKILHPTDFSVASAEALPHALEMARRHDAELVLLYVEVVPEGAEEADAREVVRRAHRLDEARLRELVSSVARVHPRVQGESIGACTAAKGILDYAIEHGISLIVLGTHGLSLRDRTTSGTASIGSTAERVVRLAPCSVMTVRPGIERAPGVITRILVPVDFSAHSRIAVGVARNLARAFAASLIVAHVIEPLIRPAFYGRGALGLVLEGRRLEDRAHEEISRMLAKLHDGVRTRTVVRRGDAAEQIVSLAIEENAHLVVQGSRGLSGIDYLLLGSVAERVVRSAPCPVLTVKGRRELQRRRQSHRRHRPLPLSEVTP